MTRKELATTKGVVGKVDRVEVVAGQLEESMRGEANQ